MAGPRLMHDSSTPSRAGFPGPASVAPEPTPEPVTPRNLDAGPAPIAPGPSRGKIWIHRLLVLLFVFVCAAAGVLLVVLPWHPIWIDNAFRLPYPLLRTVFTSGFFRGMCSGLGLLDIWIGFSEAIHYHEDKIV